MLLYRVGSKKKKKCFVSDATVHKSLKKKETSGLAVLFVIFGREMKSEA
jgi:hypothetical protein